jgi:hypothetical protein
MQVRKQQSINIFERDAKLEKTLKRPPTRIEEKFFSPHFDQSARPEPVQDRRGPPCTQEGHFENVVFVVSHDSSPIDIPF